jgi:hypothetical protein
VSRTDELLFPGMTAEAIDARLKRLRVQNIIMGVLHLLQAIAVYTLNETGFKLPIAGTYPQGPPGTPADLIRIGSLDIGLWVFAFLAISAIAHFTIASPWYFPRYSADIRRGKNTARWVEYSASSTIMVILIASVTGVVDVAAFVAIAGANIAMIAFGDLQERYLRPAGRCCRSGSARSSASRRGSRSCSTSSASATPTVTSRRCPGSCGSSCSRCSRSSSRSA